MHEHKDIHAEHGGPPKGKQLPLNNLAFNSIKVQPQLKKSLWKAWCAHWPQLPSAGWWDAAALQKEPLVPKTQHQVTWTEVVQPETACAGQ